MDNDIDISRLRYPITVYVRNQAPNTGVGIAETLEEKFIAAADIQPVGSLTYFASISADEIGDNKITHTITTRWQRGFDLTYLITREMRMPDGSSRLENYRLRRYTEVDGKQRFVRLDCNLESTVYS